MQLCTQEYITRCQRGVHSHPPLPPLNPPLKPAYFHQLIAAKTLSTNLWHLQEGFCWFLVVKQSEFGAKSKWTNTKAPNVPIVFSGLKALSSCSCSATREVKQDGVSNGDFFALSCNGTSTVAGYFHWMLSNCSTNNQSHKMVIAFSWWIGENNSL